MGVYTTEIASDTISSDNPIHQRLLKAYYVACDFVKGNMLEIGCGEGRGVDLLQNLVENYTAIDKIQEVTDKLSEEHPEATFKQMVIPPIDFKDNEFESIISFQVIEHVKDDSKYLEEIARIMKPGGVALITTPNIKMSLSRNPWHIREYTADQLEELCKPFFSKVEIKGITGNDKVMQYYEENKRSVEKLMRFDVFNLQHKLPAAVLKIPYEIMNRLNRNKLQSNDNSLVASITHDDYLVSENADQSLDLLAVLTC
ncbi:MAG: class I SAM-dependent methyltransferase [Bacteroidota bacterium]